MASSIAASATTSDTAKRPPGLSTRAASRRTRGLSVERLMTQFDRTTSTVSAGSGMSSMCPFSQCTFPTPALAWLARARSSISSVMSSPYAIPVGPTRRADSRTSIPPPEPRSSTASPSRSSATAVGLPQPKEASTAVSGSAPRSSSAYSAAPKRPACSAVMTAASAPQHTAPSAPPAASAAAA